MPYPAYLDQIGRLGPDAVIVADPGIFMMARSINPGIPIHVSTQANITNVAGAGFWKDMGAARINTAREITLSEIPKSLKKSRIEVESFVHGAMCISYSDAPAEQLHGQNGTAKPGKVLSIPAGGSMRLSKN